MGLGLEDIGRFSPQAQAQILQKVQEQEKARKAAVETEKKPKKGNKLHAEKVDMSMPDGALMHFDSKREARRYMDLWLMQKAGEIRNLRTQVRYELLPKQVNADGATERKLEYIADFVYEKNGETVVEDSKGYRNTASATYRVFVVKRKLMLYRYGITVREV